MAAKFIGLNNSGQSLVEFLFFMPLFIGIFYTLYLVNSAIQTSIVNQRFARAQALFLTFNHSHYPRRAHQLRMSENFVNLMVVGVAQNLIEGTDTSPEAQIQRIVRPGQNEVGPDDQQAEPDQRGMIRVRTTVGLCTQPNYLLNSGEKMPINSQTMIEGIRFDYCRSNSK